MRADAFQEVYAARHLHEAQFIVDVLSDQGIEARVASSALENVFGDIPYLLATCPVWVHAADADRARAAIQEWESREHNHAAESGLFCYHCGAQLDEQGETCPQCARELDWS